MRVSFPAAFLLPLVLAASAAGDVQPMVRQLMQMRLVGGFTLVYRVTVQDLRPPAFRAKEAADQEQGVEREIASGRIAKSMAGYFKKQAEDLAQPRPTENFSLTLSAEGGRLLSMSTRSARDQKEGMKTAILLDGDKEYGLYGSSAEIENDGWRRHPFTGMRTWTGWCSAPCPVWACPASI